MKLITSFLWALMFTSSLIFIDASLDWFAELNINLSYLNPLLWEDYERKPLGSLFMIIWILNYYNVHKKYKALK